MIEIEIDGKKLSVPDGSSIIEAADQNDIYIPRFCYHKKLSVAANCRMCLVEVDKVNKPLPACATPVTPDMKVKTNSKFATDAQRAVMEYLLINHPLDCPICDQGGECELQDLTVGYGLDHSMYDQRKRSVLDEDLGPLIGTSMTRCIQCTRCIRFGDEIAGMRELGLTSRGENVRVGTYVKQMMHSELSGNVIDVCPVGALVSKPYLFSARPWELRENPSISPHDCIGSNLYIHTRGHEFVEQRDVMRVVPRENEAINEVWISDRDRFSYMGLEATERVVTPKIKKDGAWQDCDWQTALNEIISRTQDIKEKYGADAIAALVSPNSTVEECYLLQKWLRELGSSHIDHRLHVTDFSDQDSAPEFPNLGMQIEGITNLETILLVGSDVRNMQPILCHRIKQAHKRGAQVYGINPYDYQFTFPLSEKIITLDIIQQLAEIAAILAQSAGEKNPAFMNLQPSLVTKKIAEKLLLNKNAAAIFLGEYAINHPHSALIRRIVGLIAKYAGVNVGVLSEGANSAGAWLAGAVPHRGPANSQIYKLGTPAYELLTEHTKRVYFVLGLELEYDCAYSGKALAALQQADMVVCMTPFISEKMLDYADIILPTAPFTETDGTFVNVAGEWQSFKAVTVPHGDAKPAWKIIQVLADQMQMLDFKYENAQQVSAELKRQVDNMPPATQTNTVALTSDLPILTNDLYRIAPYPMYRVDSLCRRSLALQQTIARNTANIIVPPEVAAALNIESGNLVIAKQGEQKICLPIHIDKRLPNNAVLIFSGLHETAGFGEANAPVYLERVES